MNFTLDLFRQNFPIQYRDGSDPAMVHSLSDSGDFVLYSHDEDGAMFLHDATGVAFLIDKKGVSSTPARDLIVTIDIGQVFAQLFGDGETGFYMGTRTFTSQEESDKLGSLQGNFVRTIVIDVQVSARSRHVKLPPQSEVPVADVEVRR